MRIVLEGRTVKKLNVIVAVLVLIAGCFVLLAQYRSFNESRIRVSTQARISQIAGGLNDFAHNHDGRFPDSLSEYAQWRYSDNGSEELPLFLLPVAGGPDKLDITTVDQWSDFVLIHGRHLSDPPKTVLLYGKSRCHSEGKAIVVFKDLSMKWVDLGQLHEFLRGSQGHPESAD